MAAKADTIVIGTRGSALAMRQTQIVLDLLRAAHPLVAFEVKTITTRGDRVQDRPISAIGDKAVFVRAIEQALLSGEIDLAVHSLKDMPADAETPGLAIAAFTPREDPRDVLISRDGCGLADLPFGSRIGTSSPRRRAQLLDLRPDLEPADIRGNVDTRLRKLDSGEYDALILAAAGLVRLGVADRISEAFPTYVFVPDAGQGIIAVQAREGSGAARLASRIDDPSSRLAGTAERCVVRALGADCRSPVGVHAVVQEDGLEIGVALARQDSGGLIRASHGSTSSDPESVGISFGRRLRARLEGQPYTEP